MPILSVLIHFRFQVWHKITSMQVERKNAKHSANMINFHKRDIVVYQILYCLEVYSIRNTCTSSLCIITISFIGFFSENCFHFHHVRINHFNPYEVIHHDFPNLSFKSRNRHSETQLSLAYVFDTILQYYIYKTSCYWCHEKFPNTKLQNCKQLC